VFDDAATECFVGTIGLNGEDQSLLRCYIGHKTRLCRMPDELDEHDGL
jgi:hypothetical protein